MGGPEPKYKKPRGKAPEIKLPKKKTVSTRKKVSAPKESAKPGQMTRDATWMTLKQFQKKYPNVTKTVKRKKK